MSENTILVISGFASLVTLFLVITYILGALVKSLVESYTKQTQMLAQYAEGVLAYKASSDVKANLGPAIQQQLNRNRQSNKTTSPLSGTTKAENYSSQYKQKDNLGKIQQHLEESDKAKQSDRKVQVGFNQLSNADKGGSA